MVSDKIAADGTYVTGIINRSAICARVGRKGKIIDKIAVKIADCAVRRIMDGTTVCIGVVTSGGNAVSDEVTVHVDDGV